MIWNIWIKYHLAFLGISHFELLSRDANSVNISFQLSDLLVFHEVQTYLEYIGFVYEELNTGDIIVRISRINKKQRRI